MLKLLLVVLTLGVAQSLAAQVPDMPASVSTAFLVHLKARAAV